MSQTHAVFEVKHELLSYIYLSNILILHRIEISERPAPTGKSNIVVKRLHRPDLSCNLYT